MKYTTMNDNFELSTYVVNTPSPKLDVKTNNAASIPYHHRHYHSLMPPRSSQTATSLGNITPLDLNLIQWPIIRIRLHTPELINYVHALDHMSEDCVLAVQMRSRTKRDEELGTVRVLASVRHAQSSLALMLQRRHDLVLELAAVDGFAATAGAGWVPSLDHEAFDDAVEDDIVVLARFGESGEVLAGLKFC